MKLGIEEAIDMLKEAEKMNNGRWIKHSKKVGEASSRIARKLDLDIEKATVLGYIHDIGKRYGVKAQHTVQGYEFLKDSGYDEEYANICLTHSYLNNDIDCTAGGYPNKNGYGYEMKKEFVKNHKYTIYEKIINICDLICTDRFVTIERRLIDIYIRKGVHENTVYHVKELYKLKDELEKKLGCTIYSLFPEITYDLNNFIIDDIFGKN